MKITVTALLCICFASMCYGQGFNRPEANGVAATLQGIAAFFGPNGAAPGNPGNSGVANLLTSIGTGVGGIIDNVPNHGRYKK